MAGVDSEGQQPDLAQLLQQLTGDLSQQPFAGMAGSPDIGGQAGGQARQIGEFGNVPLVQADVRTPMMRGLEAAAAPALFSTLLNPFGFSQAAQSQMQGIPGAAGAGNLLNSLLGGGGVQQPQNSFDFRGLLGGLLAGMGGDGGGPVDLGGGGDPGGPTDPGGPEGGDQNDPEEPGNPQGPGGPTGPGGPGGGGSGGENIGDTGGGHGEEGGQAQIFGGLLPLNFLQAGGQLQPDALNIVGEKGPEVVVGDQVMPLDPASQPAGSSGLNTDAINAITGVQPSQPAQLVDTAGGGGGVNAAPSMNAVSSVAPAASPSPDPGVGSGAASAASGAINPQNNLTPEEQEAIRQRARELLVQGGRGAENAIHTATQEILGDRGFNEMFGAGATRSPSAINAGTGEMAGGQTGGFVQFRNQLSNELDPVAQAVSDPIPGMSFEENVAFFSMPPAQRAQERARRAGFNSVAELENAINSGQVDRTAGMMAFANGQGAGGGGVRPGGGGGGAGRTGGATGPGIGADGGGAGTTIGANNGTFPQSPNQGTGTGAIQRLLQQNPEQQAFGTAQDILTGEGGLLNREPGAGVIGAMEPVFQRNLEFALGRQRNQAPSVFNSGLALQGTDLSRQALQDFNVMAQQAAQQGVQNQLSGLGTLGQLAQPAGQNPFQRALGAGQFSLAAREQAFNQTTGPTLQLLLAALQQASPTAFQTLAIGEGG